MFESGISQRKLIICRAPSLSRNRRSAPFVFVFTGDNSVLSLTFCLLTPKLQLLSSVLLPGRPVAQTPARRSCVGSRPRLLSFDLARCAFALFGQGCGLGHPPLVTAFLCLLKFVGGTTCCAPLVPPAHVCHS